MSTAIELIVDGYVRLNDRKALDDLQRHRHKLAESLKARTGFDCSKTIQQLNDEIVVIEAGLARLDGLISNSFKDPSAGSGTRVGLAHAGR